MAHVISVGFYIELKTEHKGHYDFHNEHEEKIIKKSFELCVRYLNFHRRTGSHYHEHTATTSYRFKIQINTHNCIGAHLLRFLLQLC
jgi:hypothetical protein